MALNCFANCDAHPHKYTLGCTWVSKGKRGRPAAYLGVEGELVELEVLEEAALDAAALVHGGVALGVERERLPDSLLRLAQVVLHVQLGVPVLVPVHFVDVLSRKTATLKVRSYSPSVAHGIRELRFPMARFWMLKFLLLRFRIPRMVASFRD